MSKFITVLFLIFHTVISTGLMAQCPLDIGQVPGVSNTGMLLYFPFNGNLNNQGSGSNSATVSGAVYGTGICGQGMHFDGIDDYVKITPWVSLAGNFTVTAWVHVDSLTQNLAIFATRDQCATTYRGYSQGELGINYYTAATGGSNRVRYVINTHQNCTGWSAGDRYYIPNYLYSPGSWHFIALTVQGNTTDSRVVKTYIDCQLYSMTQYMNYNTTPSFNPNNNNKTYIGAASNVSPWNFSFNGIIDEFRFYNRVLSDAEIKGVYKNCKPLKINITRYSHCKGDSALIKLINTENDVVYRLYDSTNQQYIGQALTGNCNDLIFHTGLISTAKDIYVKALKTVSGCSIVLDTVIKFNPSPGIGFYKEDSVNVCDGDSVLIAGKYYTAPATVYDSLTDIQGCDSILVTKLLSVPLPVVDLGNDTVFCNGDSVLLYVPAGFGSYYWNTGDTVNKIYVAATGMYWVNVTDSGCSNSDTISVTDISHFYIEIGDTTICEGDTWEIELPLSNQYKWFDGSMGNSIALKDSGIYWVEITDNCKTYTDSFGLSTEDCDCKIAVPNVFTPNGDGINESFSPVTNCNPDKYNLWVFNRWGMLVFETDDINKKWNGKFNGKAVPDGVYFFRIDYVHNRSSSQTKHIYGSVTVLR